MSTPINFSLSTVAILFLGATASTCIAQFISWFLLYRKETFKSSQAEILRLNRRYEKLKSTHVIQSESKHHEKKIAAVESQLKSLGNQATFGNMKVNVLSSVVAIGTIYLLGTIFQGIVVARLPFEPWGLFKGITHRNLAGQDFTECSYLFIYILSGFSVRANLKRYLGNEPVKPAVSSFSPPEYKTE